MPFQMFIQIFIHMMMMMNFADEDTVGWVACEPYQSQLKHIYHQPNYINTL